LLADAVQTAGTWCAGVEDDAQFSLTARALWLALQLVLKVTLLFKFLPQGSDPNSVTHQEILVGLDDCLQFCLLV
jgi:hypothetical protein